MTSETPDYLALNRASWDEVTAHHLASPFYKTEAFRAGQNVLDPLVRQGIGQVAGRRLLHLQCHFGLDTLSLARMGAEVTGLDFSRPAIAAARALAAETGTPARFVEANALEPPPGLAGFDIVFASWGAICWIPDMAAWMRVAAGALKPGGRLYLVEGHPVLGMLDDRGPAEAPFALFYPYDQAEGIMMSDQEDYASDAKLAAHTNVQFYHGLARILNGAINAGFTITRFDELDRIPWKNMPQLVKLDEYYWGLPHGVPRFPLAFALSAVKA